MNVRSDIKVTLIRAHATDQDVAAAARVSTNGELGARSVEPFSGLINFLMRDRHGSPFEHNSFSFMIQAPIFVAREHMRHRAGWSYNEESGRYRELKPEFYMPASDRNLVQVGKAGAYSFEPGTEEQHGIVNRALLSAYDTAYDEYRWMLSQGIAREVARAVLPVGIYTTYFASCNARSLMHFLSLRTKRAEAKVPSFPQREIEMVAEQMEETFRKLMPLTHGAFERHGRVAP